MHPSPAVNPFSDDVNPYAAPQRAWEHPAQAAPQPLHPLAGLWRQGNLLVMHKSAPLPDICVKSNQPATRRLQRKLQWHHPAVALSILIAVPVYVILALVLMKRATIMLPLSDEWYERRKRRLIFAWGSGLLCLGLIVVGFVLGVQVDNGGYLLLSLMGFVGGIAALIYGQYACAMVRPTRITDQYVWLKGVHPDFLQRLEAWQWNI
jgi:hypothetical protein